MKKITIAVLTALLFSHASYGMEHKSKLEQKKEQTHSLLERYVPGARTVKTVVVLGVAAALFGRAVFVGKETSKVSGFDGIADIYKKCNGTSMNRYSHFSSTPEGKLSVHDKARSYVRERGNALPDKLRKRCEDELFKRDCCYKEIDHENLHEWVQCDKFCDEVDYCFDSTTGKRAFRCGQELECWGKCDKAFHKVEKCLKNSRSRGHARRGRRIK